MTDQEINEAIALALGSPCIETECQYCLGCGETGGESDAEVCFKCNGSGVEPPYYTGPNYCTDLNAMHEAEKTLHATNDWRILRAYFKWISPEIHEDWALDGDDWKLCHATARQRAEAFLRTIGKWKESV